MTLLAAPAPTEQPPDQRRGLPTLLRNPALLGLIASAGTLALVLLIAALIAGTDPRSSVSGSTTMHIGATAWLALHGTGIVAGDTSLTLIPLLLVLLPVAAAFGTVRRVLVDVQDGHRPLPAALAQWWFGYAVGVVIAVVLTLGGPTHPMWWRLIFAPVLVPALGVAWALARLTGTQGAADPGDLFVHLPTSLRRAWQPAVRGVVTLLALGALAVVALAVVHRDRVFAVHQALDPQGVGGVVLWLAQVAALPNLAIWAVSFTAGTGFDIVDGASVTWSGFEGGLLPLIPVFGAMPQPGAFPWFTAFVVLIPIAVGAAIGQRAVRQLPRLSAMRAKAATAATAAGLTAALIGALAVLGGADLGTYRLAGMGAPVHWLVPALAVELLAGALLAVLWDGWRLRR